MPAIYKNGKNYGGGTTVDSALSSTSTNPVQNKVVKQALDELILNFANYYNKTEVDNIVNTIKNSRFEAVSTLPTTDIKTNVIYLVPKSPTQTNNAKDEYINLDGTSSGWEKIGDTEIDLSGYVTTTALNTALSDYTTTTDLTTLLNNKVDKVTGKVLSTNDYTNEEKQKNADNASAISDIQEDISQSLTATGNPLTIESSESNLVECVAEVEAEQDLHGYDHPWVGGAGKNKWDEETIYGYRLAENGSYFHDTNELCSKNLIPVSPSTSYRLVGGGNSVITYNSNQEFISGFFVSAGEIFTTPSDCYYIHFNLGNFYGNVYNHDVGVIYPSSEMTYSPYTNICPISGRSEVAIQRVGKNLISEIESGMINIATGQDATSDIVSRTKGYIPTNPSTAYTFSGLVTDGNIRVFEYGKDKSFLGSSVYSSINKTVTLTVSENTYFIRAQANDTIINTTAQIQCELGSTPTSYEPYAGKTYTIQLGQTVYGGTLDVTKDELRVDTGYLSADTITGYNPIVNICSIGQLSNAKVADNYHVPNAICDKYTMFPATSVYSGTSTGITIDSTGSCYFRDTRFSSKSEYESYLASNPLQLVYELATPYTIQLTPQQIRLLKGTNNISCNTGDLSIKYYPDNVLGQLKGDIESEYDGRIEALEEKGGDNNAMQKGVDYVTAGQLAGSTLGAKATAEGRGTVASKENSHAEGSFTTASGFSSHAEGGDTLTSGSYSHAEGTDTSARGDSSHAEGNQAVALGTYSHAEGENTVASGTDSHAEGCYTTASNYASHAGGHYNVAMTPGGNPYNTTGTAFVIGNGVHTSALGNAFSVQYNGVVKAASTITASTTADYAEFFEWVDGNPNNEDRVGYFVTIDENEPTKIRIANSNDDYILGIVSGTPFVLGNGDCDVWNGMVMKDEFGRIIYEPAQKYEINPETGEEEPVYDEDGNPVYEGTKPVYNPEYDPTIPYISRFDRPEWSPVGMLGVLHVRDDGSCTINGYCTVGENGIATKTDSFTQTSYKVIARINSNIIKVIFR